MDREYKILKVERRKEWTGTHGTFQDYVVHLEGVEGWVTLTQKPDTMPPQPGSTIFGHTVTQTHGDQTYLKFKKVNPNYSGGGNSGGSATSANELVGTQNQLDRIEMMLEELTGRRDRTPSDDISAPPREEEFTLPEIPFD